MEVTHRKKNLKIFSLTFNVDLWTDITKKLILNYPMTLEDEMEQYFPNISVDMYDWMRHVVRIIN